MQWAVLKLAAGFLALIGIASLLYLATSYLSFSDDDRQDSVDDVNQVISFDCPVHAVVCSVNVNDHLVSISLAPKGLPALKPLSLTISSEADIEVSKAWFQGRDMDMGTHFFQSSSSDDAHAARFTGMIPVCTVDRSMIWQLNVEVTVGERRVLLKSEMSSAH